MGQEVCIAGLHTNAAGNYSSYQFNNSINSPDPCSPKNDDPSFQTGQNAGRTSVACLAAAGGLQAARFRGLEWGRCKDAGQWQKGPHFHLDWGNGFGDHHLPQQTWRFWKNLKGVIGRWWNE